MTITHQALSNIAGWTGTLIAIVGTLAAVPDAARESFVLGPKRRARDRMHKVLRPFRRWPVIHHAVVLMDSSGSISVVSNVQGVVAPSREQVQAYLKYLDDEIGRLRKDLAESKTEALEAIRVEGQARETLAEDLRARIADTEQLQLDAERNSTQINAGALPALAYGTALSGFSDPLANLPLVIWIAVLGSIIWISVLAIYRALRA